MKEVEGQSSADIIHILSVSNIASAFSGCSCLQLRGCWTAVGFFWPIFGFVDLIKYIKLMEIRTALV